MRSSVFIILSVLGFGLAGRLGAGAAELDSPRLIPPEQNEGRSATIDLLVAETLQGNPELAFYEAEIAAAKAGRRDAGVWPNPEVDVDVGRKRAYEPAGGLAGEGTAWSVSVAQPLEFPGRIAVRKAIANREVEMAELGLQQFRATLASRVRELAYRLFTAQAVARAAQDAAERGQELMQVLVQRDPAGINPLLESRLIEASVITLNSRATDALTRSASLRADLNQLRGKPLEEPLKVTPPQLEFLELPPPARLVEQARTNNFEVRAQRLELAQQGLRVDLARKYRWEPITVSPFFSREEAGEREEVVGVGLSIPVPLWNRNSGNIQAAEARQQQAEVAVYLTQRRIERELRAGVADYEARLAQMSAWRAGIEESLAESAELADRHYRLGSVPVATYVEIQEKYLEALETILRTRAEAWDAAQRIQLLTGDFERELISRKD